MSKIFLTSPSGAQSQHDETEARSLFDKGLLEAGTKYWREGMPEWRPLNELFQRAPRPVSPIAPGPDATTPYSYTKDPRSLTSFLMAMLWITLGFDVVSALGEFGQMSLLSRDFTQAEAETNAIIQNMIVFGYLAVSIVTGVAFLTWIHRANLNCRGFGARDMRFTPGWSVGYFFVPFLNLVRPYESMKEIWGVSHDPQNWKFQRGSRLLGWWWALWIISGITSQVIFHLSLAAKSIEDLKALTALSIFSCMVGIALCLVVLSLIKRISSKQEELVKRSPQGGGEPGKYDHDGGLTRASS